jgi:hypothetical protein
MQARLLNAGASKGGGCIPAEGVMYANDLVGVSSNSL